MITTISMDFVAKASFDPKTMLTYDNCPFLIQHMMKDPNTIGLTGSKNMYIHFEISYLDEMSALHHYDQLVTFMNKFSAGKYRLIVDMSTGSISNTMVLGTLLDEDVKTKVFVTIDPKNIRELSKDSPYMNIAETTHRIELSDTSVITTMYGKDGLEITMEDDDEETVTATIKDPDELSKIINALQQCHKAMTKE